jgi:hypothetical protein
MDHGMRRSGHVVPLLVTLLLFGALFMVINPLFSAPQGRRWAVVVGINKYQKEVSPLRCAMTDAQAFKKALIDTAGFKEDDIFLLTNDQTGNRVPDKSSIIRWISYVKQHAEPQDSFIFFFSGHGMDMENESYLLTVEADPYSKDTLDASSLKVSDLKKYLGDMKAGKILVFIDACRNDPRSGKGDRDNALSEKFSKSLIISPAEKQSSEAQACATFFSCQVSQRSYEWTEKNMGFFTYYLVKGMEGEAKDGQGKVTLNSLEHYLGKAVPAAVERERGYKQDPWVSRSGPSSMGEIAIASIPLSSSSASGQSSSPGKRTPAQEAPHVTVTAVPAQEGQRVTVTALPANPEPTVTSKPAQSYQYSQTSQYSQTGTQATPLPYNEEWMKRIEHSGTASHQAQGGNDHKNALASLNKTSALFAIIDQSNDIRDLGQSLDQGADINGRNGEGMTPLHWAVLKGKQRLAEFLIKRGAQVNARDNLGRTPLKLAREMGNKDIESMLISIGGRE